MRIVQHGANSVAYLAGGFRDFLPDRREHMDDVSCGDTAGRNIAKLGEGVVLQTGQPLARVYSALPARLVFGVILCGGFAEGHLGGSLVLALRQNIAIFDLHGLAQFIRFFACLSQCDQLGAANSDVPTLAVLLEPQQP